MLRTGAFARFTFGSLGETALCFPCTDLGAGHISVNLEVLSMIDIGKTEVQLSRTLLIPVCHGLDQWVQTEIGNGGQIRRLFYGSQQTWAG